MTTPDDLKNLRLFVIDEIQKQRRWTTQPGPQHADDPRRLLEVMQRTKMQSVKIPSSEVNRLYDIFATEAQAYRQQWSQYVKWEDYDEFLKSIKEMLEHMTH
jgi:hypothetical protein